MRTRHHGQSGFSLTEMLIVICILIGLMTLIAPKGQQALHKQKNLRALNQCKAMSDALMQYIILRDGNACPADPVMLSDYDLTAMNRIDNDPPSFGDDPLRDLLSPSFLPYVPFRDPWGNAWEVYGPDTTFLPPGATIPTAPDLYVGGPHVFLIRSAGANGQFEDDGGEYRIGPYFLNQDPLSPQTYGDDIVCADGVVIRWPGRWGTLDEV